jgi:ABC-type multidrug transport system ATPase subunit
VVLATNEIREAPFWAHRIVFLHRGRVLADAPPARLLEAFRGRTMIQVTLAGPPPPPETLAALQQVSGVIGLRVTSGVEGEDGAAFTRVTAETREAGRPLPLLLQLLVEAGAQVREVRIREPGLSDLFRALTGEELDSTPSGDVP